MRNLQLEAAIWYLFTSMEFFEAAARECDGIVDWQISLATSQLGIKCSPNKELVDKFRKRAGEFRRGAELARLGEYKFVSDIAGWISSDVRNMIEQSPNGWTELARSPEFNGGRISRLSAYAGRIKSALHNALTGAEIFFDPDPDCPERSNDDDGYPGDDIVGWYNDYLGYFNQPSLYAVPDPLPKYVIDRSIVCRTGDEVPWTGVWYPDTGLERHSLTFAIKGLRMQPAFRVIKTKEELRAEGVLTPYTKTVAVATTWHPVIPSGRFAEIDKELRAKAGEPCPKAGIWESIDTGAMRQRSYEAGETMGNLGSAYGITVWRWMADH